MDEGDSQNSREKMTGEEYGRQVNHEAIKADI